MPASKSPLARVRSVPRLYRKHFADRRKERQFISSASFFTTFAIVRAITHAIRANVGPFKNVTPGGRHIHHMTFGIIGLLTVGYLWMLEFGVAPTQRRSSRLTSGAYGAGAALTLDEFALWLNLQDVYWAKQGRESIDAVVLFGALLSMGLVGREFLTELARAEQEVEHEGEEHLEHHGQNGAGSGAPIPSR
ncbi:MAG: hypothetical protein E6G05_01170 [Actinobacteria bacterium]|jgi:hypothetical protein|nr:MAG: hypothetical protein E6G05_01170 [Actinomycetota bacterium]